MNQKKVAVITGGASGIGYAIAEKFVENGICTYILGRNEQKLAEASEALGDKCKSIVFDITQLDAIPAFVKKIVDREGQIDILVNNAGINLKKPMTEVTDEEFQKVILTNLTSVFSLTREIAKVMIQ